VNYAVERSAVAVDKEARTITLFITIDTGISPVSDYFEIFLERMLLCRKSAQVLGYRFGLTINGTSLM
jgi:hypothetical protein